MTKHHHLGWIASIGLILFPSALALAEPAGDRVELAVLIESLLVDEGSKVGLFDWAWGSETDDPIVWQHVGIREAPESLQKKYGHYERTGDVVITIDGKVTHSVLAEKKYPGRFSVTLRGPRGGFTTVVIESDVNHPDLCGLPLESLSGGLSLEPYKCRNEPASSGTPVFTVKKKGKKDAWLRNEYSGGSAGCSQTLELVFDRARADQVQCWGEE